MTVFWCATGLAAALSAFQAVEGPPVADAVNLRDGAVVLGLVSGVDRRGELGVVVRRAWAEEQLPALAPVWARLEAEQVRNARLERRDRLQQWRRERAPNAQQGDLVLPWIDREVQRMSDPRPPRTVLMRVALPRGDVVSVARREPQASRLLRLGWLAGLGGAESMGIEPLVTALSARGGVRFDSPAAVDALLPLASETDAAWLHQRAATEAVFEGALRFVRFREFILPESGPAVDAPAQVDTTELLDSPAAQEAYRAMLRVAPGDPVRLRLDLAAQRGRVGAIVSRIEVSSDLPSAEAESALWARKEGTTWGPVFSKRATVKSNAPADPPGTAPAPSRVPIRTALNVIELFGASASPPELARARQSAAVAAQRALGWSRALLDQDLAPLILPVVAPRR